jgi:hypothetical protein
VLTVQPIAGTPGSALSMRTSVSGTFEFSGLAGGLYVLNAVRPGFMPVEHGQKRWNSSGQPIFLEPDASTFLGLRMHRYSAISGTIMDENDIGLPDRDVVAYRNTRPPQIVARAKSNDRGEYRVAGLDPGSYLVRTAGASDEEGSYLPTFAKETIATENARQVDVDLDYEAVHVDVRPLQGQLISVSGTVSPPQPTTVTLATDMGRQKIITDSAFRFGGVMPGSYQIYAEAPVDDNAGGPFQGAYLFAASRTNATHTLLLTSNTNLRIEIRGVDQQAVESGTLRVMARRKDLAGYAPVIQVKPGGDRFALRAGIWEVRLVPPAGYYVSDLLDVRRSARGVKSRPDTWNEVMASGGYLRFTLSSPPSSLSGTVKNGGDPAMGAPVFLEAWDEETRQRLAEDVRSTWTDLEGRYSFNNLGPGTYRVLATFEYRDPDPAAMELAGAQTVRVEARSAPRRDLSLYVIR